MVFVSLFYDVVCKYIYVSCLCLEDSFPLLNVDRKRYIFNVEQCNSFVAFGKPCLYLVSDVCAIVCVLDSCCVEDLASANVSSLFLSCFIW
jgi:hypothetical protein